MRISMLALTAILASAAVPATAQTVIDVESQKPPPQVQDQARPQEQTPPLTQERPQLVPPSRYSLNRVDDGFLRLDNETGQLAYCHTYATGWACQAVSEGRVAFEAEIARLRDEIASLKKPDMAITRLQDEIASLKKLEIAVARLQDEIASLKQLETAIAGIHDEIYSLKKEVAALKEPAPPRPPADLAAPTAGKGGDVTIKLPTQEDMARARSFVEDTWRRLVDMIVTIQKDMMRKG